MTTRSRALVLALCLCVALTAAPAAYARRRGSKGLGTIPSLERPQPKFAIRGAEYATFEERSPNVTWYIAAGDRAPRGVPPFQPMAAPPSGDAHSLPFLFIHQPKSAGTSVRQALVRQVQHLGSGAVGDPCIPDALPCPITDTPLHTVAGHYRYMHAREALVQRNRLPPDTSVPCLTYIRKPVERLTSFYYWMLHERGDKDLPTATYPALQTANPVQAVYVLTRMSSTKRHFFHMPFLSLFGTLRTPDYTRYQREYMADDEISDNVTVAIHRAVAVARHNLRACLIANTDDMGASEELIAYFLPWLNDALRADAVPRSNGRARQRHPTVVLPDGSPAPESLLGQPLPNITRHAIEAFYAADMEVYNYALHLHRQQLQYVRARRQS